MLSSSTCALHSPIYVKSRAHQNSIFWNPLHFLSKKKSNKRLLGTTTSQSFVVYPLPYSSLIAFLLTLFKEKGFSLPWFFHSHKESTPFLKTRFPFTFPSVFSQITLSKAKPTLALTFGDNGGDEALSMWVACSLSSATSCCCGLQESWYSNHAFFFILVFFLFWNYDVKASICFESCFGFLILFFSI